MSKISKELIESYRKIVIPFVAKQLYNMNFEGQGKRDKAEFEEHSNEILDLAIKALEEKEADRWIPVIERVPDKNIMCLVSLDFGDVDIDSFIDGNFVCYLGNVIAWMELPNPYESKSEVT